MDKDMDKDTDQMGLTFRLWGARQDPRHRSHNHHHRLRSLDVRFLVTPLRRCWTRPPAAIFLSEMLLFRETARREKEPFKKTFRNRGGHNLAKARSRGDGDGDGDGERRARG